MDHKAERRVTSPKPTTNKVPEQRVGELPKRWSFSFEHWKQREHFGLSPKGDDSSWYVALLDRLKELSCHEIENVLADSNFKDAHRMHGFNWEDPRMGVTKEQYFEFVPKHYRNLEDFEPIQFEITTALGRVVGFIDEQNIFQIVVLDSKHNFFLSDYSDYKKRPTSVKRSAYGELYDELNAIKSGSFSFCKEKPCPGLARVNEVVKSAAGKQFVCLLDVEPELGQLLYEKYNGVHDYMVVDMIGAFMDAHKAALPERFDG
jgi:hypothetical protein